MNQFSYKRIMLTIIAVLFISIIYSPINAAVYYASPTGNGTGTLASPCSFATGLTKIIAPGDTLYLRGGIYYLSAKVSINKSGTANARIAIMAFPNEKPILDFSAEPYSSSNPGVSLSGTSSYLHLKGLVIRYAGDNGLINNGNNHIIEDCEFYGNCDTGLQHKSGGNNLILNCDSHDNFDYESGGLTVANFGGNADGFADKQYTGTDPNTFEGCRSWNNADDGWDFFQKIGSTNLKNCICYKNGPATFNMTNHPRYLVDQAWFNQFPVTVTNANGTTDQITLAAYKNYGNGNGFKLGGGFTAHDVSVIRCLSVGNTVRGFDQNNNYGTMTLYNNSSYQNGYNYGFGTGTGGTLIIKNCVSLSSTNTNAFSSKTVTNVNNSWNTTGITTNSSDFVSMDTSLILAPRNADGSYSTQFMHLVAGSDLIDAGLNVGIPFSGAKPDLGYFEFGTINQFPPLLTGQNTTQTVVLGNPINTITFTWSGGATGVDTTNIPAGLTVVFDTNNKTVTIQGTPTILGSYQYSVSTIGGVGSPVVISGTINVTSASAKRIAYFTTLPIAAPDSMIYNKLSANPDFNIVLIDATSTTIDYSGFDAVVMSSVPSSTAAGFPVLEALNKPKLLLKPFTLKSTVWNWINTTTAINTTQTGVTITNKTHPIFSGLTFTGASNDQLTLFSNIGLYSITGITNSNWIATPAVSVLGNANGSTTTNTIVEFPLGVNMNGTVINQRFVMIGLSEYSTATLTTTATQLIENTVYYILGNGVPLPVDFNSIKVTDVNNTATVTWNVSNQRDIKYYQVQRSSNAKEYTTIATVDAFSNSEYSYIDNKPLNGKSYYRIVATGYNAKESISSVVPFVAQQDNRQLLLLNNPVMDNKIQFQLKNFETGNVSVKLYNTSLKEIADCSYFNEGNLTTRSIKIPNNTPKGIYVIRVISASGQSYSKQISIL